MWETCARLRVERTGCDFSLAQDRGRKATHQPAAHPCHTMASEDASKVALNTKGKRRALPPGNAETYLAKV